jgi:3-hydroxyacyl-[acyl-carrier-protein] dehydratase
MTEPKTLDIEAIINRLPHRFPFLLVDRVLSMTHGKSIVAVKNVTFNEAHFAGHFPQHPVMPGVLIVEALAQAGGILAWESAEAEEQDAIHILYLVGLENVRLRLPVTPGDQLILKAELTRSRRGLWRFACSAEVDGKTAAEAEIIMVSRKEP